MKLQDYIHYYIGCRCLNTWYKESELHYDAKWILNGFRINNTKCYFLENDTEETWTDSIKPILRKLDSITNEECEAYNQILFTMHSVNKLQDQMKTQAACVDYLLKLGFDLFGLIEAGLAIDSKTLK